jgi:hypothetical protein
MILAASETVEKWPEAAVAIAGIGLVTAVAVVVVWQLLATWRTRMVGSRETAYRDLAEQVVETQARTTAALEEVVAELRALREEPGATGRAE